MMNRNRLTARSIFYRFSDVEALEEIIFSTPIEEQTLFGFQHLSDLTKKYQLVSLNIISYKISTKNKNNQT